MLSMTVASDLCRCVGAPLKIPPISGVQRIFLNITEKGPLPISYQIDELTSQTSQSHVSYTYLPSALEIPN
jgi:hypothetical protein